MQILNMTSSRVRTTIIAWVAVCLSLLGPLASIVVAQAPSGWSPPQTISSEDTHGASPTLAVDPSGAVHAFWSSQPIGQDGATEAISYARYRDGAWSNPAEILFSPGDQSAWFPRAIVDGSGRLHLFWSAPGSGVFGPLYHSWAPATDALSPRNWASPQLIAEGTYQSDVRLEPNGRLHVVYASVSDGAGICHIASEDHGDSWSEPSCVQRSYTLRPDEAETRPRLAIDSQGTLHVTWMLDDYSVQSKLAYSGRALIYAHSKDGGATWSSPLIIDEIDGRSEGYDRQVDGLQPEWGNIIVDNQDRVHIVWVGRPDMQRYHQWSGDGGVTWSPRAVVIPAGGYNSWQGLAVDGAGTVHLVWPSLEGIQYTRWRDGAWSSPVLLPGDVGAAHYAQAVVALGNQLHAVWQDHGGQLTADAPGRVLHALLITDAPAAQPEPLPTMAYSVASTPEPAAGAPISPAFTPAPLPSETREEGAATPAARATLTSPDSPPNVSSPAMPVIIGVVPALLLVGIVVLWQIRRR